MREKRIIPIQFHLCVTRHGSSLVHEMTFPHAEAKFARGHTVHSFTHEWYSLLNILNYVELSLVRPRDRLTLLRGTFNDRLHGRGTHRA